KRWLEIADAGKKVPAPSLLYQELSLAQRVLRDVVTDQTHTVQIDSRENFVALQAFAAQYVPQVSPRLVHYAGERPLFDLYQIDDTIFKTNLEAAQSIARQLRLRNLGGIIVVDFIDMMNAEHRDAVLGEFKKALARDRTRMTVS